ncbi:MULTISPECIES: GNAT family N-acetyltransferase [unclassified Streptomyces]|uniref:GNAT family N-acetyltransferase n=1 Tax=unclassified Streptomyces TaxID=2593676 RepID=UPI0022864495|nr:GNAT family protein [Streptomyces sp. Je 1-369]WAL93088.1 GNAT family N-acetyltransferase [Streptomyces sp. Je 1-369]WAL99892.1 GNAT family N-acetyltransferase [Streptomyces sp. Je 1-369]
MLQGRTVALRARHPQDIPLLQAGLYDDVATHARADARPWRPIVPGSGDTHFAVDDTEQRHAAFSVVEREGGTLLGAAGLWHIDTHNRTAHLGLALLPAARGQGRGGDAVAVLCHYAFVVRGLQRLQIETLADNTAMLRCAERNGFVREGVLRSSAWVMGRFADEVVLGLLAQDYR